MIRIFSALFAGAATSIDAAEAARCVDAGELLLVDVRERSERQRGHPAGARHVPLASVGGRLDELARQVKAGRVHLPLRPPL